MGAIPKYAAILGQLYRWIFWLIFFFWIRFRSWIAVKNWPELEFKQNWLDSEDLLSMNIFNKVIAKLIAYEQMPDSSAKIPS